MINPGKLRHLVRIERPVNANDPQGRLKPTWEKVADTLAAIEPLSARELIAADQAQSRIDTRITIRHRTDISPEMRIVHGEVIYRVMGLVPDNHAGVRYIVIPAHTGVSRDGS